MKRVYYVQCVSLAIVCEEAALLLFVKMYSVSVVIMTAVNMSTGTAGRQARQCGPRAGFPAHNS